MVITVPESFQDRWTSLLPLLLRTVELNVDVIAAVWECSRYTVMPNIKKMRQAGLPIPQVAQRDCVDDYGYCPDCGELLTVGMVGHDEATVYCPECAWDAELDWGQPVHTQFVTTAQAAEMLGVGTSTVLRWIKNEELPAKRKGPHNRSGWKIPLPAIEARL